MVTSEHAYTIARAALHKDLIPVLIPGRIGGQPAVHIHGYPLEHFPAAVIGTPVERLMTNG